MSHNNLQNNTFYINFLNTQKSIIRSGYNDFKPKTECSCKVANLL